MTSALIAAAIVIAVLILLNAFFSAAETALTGASRARMATLEREGDHASKRVNALNEDRERMIGAVLLGANIVQVAASAIAASIFVGLYGEVYGPWITTADEVPEPGDLALRTWINGELRQDSRTSDLIFSVPQIVDFLRETITLEPGDLILTGTPSGVGMYFDPPRFLGSGDVVRIEIEALGTIEHAVA